MNFLNKGLRLFLFFTLSFTILMNSRPAIVGAGLVAGSPVLVTAGLVVGVAGLGAGFITFVKVTTDPDPISALFKLLIGGALTAAILGLGFLVLDGEQGLSFEKLTVAEAKQIGLTAIERQRYNAEIDQVNALAAHVDHEISQLKDATVDDSAAIWSSVKEAVSPETYSAMQKVSAQLYK